LAVSHDRAFLDKLVDRVVSIDEAGFVSWDGNFSEFWFRSGAGAGLRRPGSAAATLAARGRVKASEARAAAVPAPSGAASADAARKALLAARIERLETERGELERQAAAALAAKDFKEGGRRANEAAALAKTIDRLYAEWAG
jgi:ATPase subunit of ABC transporter with duplicated ATPase domains